MSVEDNARQLICQVGRSLFERGYVHSTAGNISVALPDKAGGGYLITPSDACLGFLDPEALARTDSALQQTSGARMSKTIQLHHRIYTAAAATGQPAGCIIHTHSTNCVAATFGVGPRDGPHFEPIPPITPYFVMKVGHVPLIPYARPGADGVAIQVEAAIHAYAAQDCILRAVLLEHLGPVVWAGCPMSAMAVLEELEETARLWMMSGATLPPLSPQALAELEEVFGARW